MFFRSMTLLGETYSVYGGGGIISLFNELIPGGGDIQFFGHPDESCEGLGAHLAHDPTTVQLNGDLAGAQFRSDLLVEETGDDELHHVPLTVRQRVIMLAQHA